jgi:hypothetical protein
MAISAKAAAMSTTEINMSLNIILSNFSAKIGVLFD